MKILTIGDSISQGFMSMSAARTDLSYSTLIANQLGIPSAAQAYPEWPQGGLPLNLERVLRRLNKRFGSDIRGIEWPFTLQQIYSIMDEVEDYYERGEGALDMPAQMNPIAGAQYHNVAARGFTVADAWQLTAKDAYDKVLNSPGRGDDLVGLPSESFYRTAARVLNPALDPAYNDYTQLKWLEHHNEHSSGVENLLLWLGANNALGTILKLNINQTSRDGDAYQNPDEYNHFQREDVKKWNLWHPEDFKKDYEVLLNKINAIQKRNKQKDWRVFVGTVPLVTIAPVLSAVGNREDVEVDVYDPFTGEKLEKKQKISYGQYYTYFPFDLAHAHDSGLHLNRAQVLHIDACIRRYNSIIAQLVNQFNKELGRPAYYIVDIAGKLNQIALRRNKFNPTYEYPSFFDFIYPRVDARYYHCDDRGNLKQGGIVSLDGVHPSVIGQGLIGYEFLKVMKNAGVPGTDPAALNWKAIFDSDDLYGKPITLMKELYQHDDFLQWLLKIIL